MFTDTTVCTVQYNGNYYLSMYFLFLSFLATEPSKNVLMLFQ